MAALNGKRLQLSKVPPTGQKGQEFTASHRSHRSVPDQLLSHLPSGVRFCRNQNLKTNKQTCLDLLLEIF